MRLSLSILLAALVAAGAWPQGFGITACCGGHHGGQAVLSAPSLSSTGHCCSSAPAAQQVPATPAPPMRSCCQHDAPAPAPVAAPAAHSTAGCHCMHGAMPLAGVSTAQPELSTHAVTRPLVPWPSAALVGSSSVPALPISSRGPPDWIQPMAAGDLDLRHRRLLI